MAKESIERKERPVSALTHEDIETIMLELTRVQAFQRIIIQTADSNCLVLKREHALIEAPVTVSIRILDETILRLENLLKPTSV